jgi:hypothetical protein
MEEAGALAELIERHCPGVVETGAGTVIREPAGETLAAVRGLVLDR